MAQGRGEPWWPGPIAGFSLFLALAPPEALLLVPWRRDLDLATQSLLEELASPASAWFPALAWPPALALLASCPGTLAQPELLELAGSPSSLEGA